MRLSPHVDSLSRPERLRCSTRPAPNRESAQRSHHRIIAGEKGLIRIDPFPKIQLVAIVVIAWLSWSAGGTMKALAAIATVAFLGQMTQVIAMVRTGFMGTRKGEE
jgi:hypothetical protein